MVRYLHYEAERIRDHIQSQHLAVTRCDFQKKSAPIEVEPSAVAEMLEKSQTLWGTALPHYLYVSQSFKGEAPSLNDAVSNVEALLEADAFLIVAYQDGGLITVSGSKLPFQADVQDASWWGPYKSASRKS